MMQVASLLSFTECSQPHPSEILETHGPSVVAQTNNWVEYFPHHAPHQGSPSKQATGVSSVKFSCSVMSDSLRPHESQHTRPPCPSPTPRVYSNSSSLSRWCHPVISSSVIPASHPLSSPPSQHQGLFQWVNSLHDVAKALEFQLQHQSFQWTPRTDLL